MILMILGMITPILGISSILPVVWKIQKVFTKRADKLRESK